MSPGFAKHLALGKQSGQTRQHGENEGRDFWGSPSRDQRGSAGGKKFVYVKDHDTVCAPLEA